MKKLMMTLMLMPMMALATTWYVNGTSGSDSNSGKSQSSAKRTIQAAINSSSAGDTILVAPGTYAPITTDNKAITIKSTAGTSDTVIDGAGASQRCVTACADEHDKGIYTNTVMIGFTLQNGDGHGAWGGCANGGIYKGCVMLNGTGGNAGNAILENCLVKGGRGINGGNLIGCVARNCTIVDGYAEDNGGAYYNCAVFNSICYNNDSGWRWGDDGGTGYQVGSWDWGALVVAFGGQLVNVYKDDPNFMDAANGDYRLSAESPCIDAGDNSYVTGDTDLAGNARIANGTVDIGCYEYGAVGMIPGFYRVQISCSDFDSTTSIWDSSDKTVTLYPSELYATECPEYTMYAFASYMWMEGGVTYNFKAGYDDRSTIVVNGETVCVLEGKWGYFGYDCQENEGSYTPTVSGWYPVELRAWNRSGEGGATTDEYHPVSGFWYNSSDDSIWRKFEDSGEGAKFRAVVGDGAKVESFTVTFDLNGAGGAAPSGRSIAHGAAVGTLPTPTRTGYAFTGWFTAAGGGSQVSASTKVTGDVTYYAHWTATSYTPPTWTPVAKEDTMVVFATVFDVSTGRAVDAYGTRLAAFDLNGECRGVATVMDGPSGRLFQLSVGIEGAAERGFVLKAWDPETGRTSIVAERVA